MASKKNKTMKDDKKRLKRRKIKNGRQTQKKMEDQNQPYWLRHHCKFT
jgi:hypothetical protein